MNSFASSGQFENQRRAWASAKCQIWRPRQTAAGGESEKVNNPVQLEICEKVRLYFYLLRGFASLDG